MTDAGGLTPADGASDDLDAASPLDGNVPADAGADVEGGTATPRTEDDAGCSARPALPSSGPACLVLFVAVWSLSCRRRVSHSR
jgi:hypothetical protein